MPRLTLLADFIEEKKTVFIRIYAYKLMNYRQRIVLL